MSMNCLICSLLESEAEAELAHLVGLQAGRRVHGDA